MLNGLLLGAIYLLIALGLSLIFSLGGIVNLAHGAFYAHRRVPRGRADRRRIGFAGALVASPVLVGAASASSSSASCSAASTAPTRSSSLLLTFGLAMVAEQGLRMIFGASPLPYSIPRRCAARSSSATSSIRTTG